jgi:hypothetical protein
MRKFIAYFDDIRIREPRPAFPTHPKRGFQSWN